MIVVTTDAVAGRQIAGTGAVVSGCAVLGLNAVRDWFMSLTNFWGGRSRSAIAVVRQAEEQAMAEMIAAAEKMGADAVVGMRFRTLETGGATMVGVACYGTAVRLA